MGIRGRESKCVGEERTERVSVGCGRAELGMWFCAMGFGVEGVTVLGQEEQGYRGNGVLRTQHKVGSKGGAWGMLFGLGRWGAAWWYRD